MNSEIYRNLGIGVNTSRTTSSVIANVRLVRGIWCGCDLVHLRNHIEATKEALRTISQTESYLTITAPFDGVVTTRNLHPGALIGPASGAGGAQPILQIADDRHLRLVVPIPEAQIGDNLSPPLSLPILTDLQSPHSTNFS
jgi:multidrug efflux pump subunit AcrA (membrane-fusion protein)